VALGRGDEIRGNRLRLIRHAWVLLAALLVPVLAPRPAAPLAAAVSVPRASSDIILSAIIERPATVPPIAARPAQTIVVAGGQTVESLAAANHSDASAIRWANSLGSRVQPAAGTTLLLPPGPGALVPVLAGERPSHFAIRLGIDPRVLLDYNALAKDTGRAAGSYLQVPLSAAPAGALVGRYFARANGAVPMIVESHGPDTFPFGQCTYYAASRRDVTWGGNAWAWFENANGVRPEGHVPVTGAIVVFHDGWFGHVAYVEGVNPDGSFVISEMNFWTTGGGWGRVDRRYIAANDRGITGFIY
jgi:LysM repeat protein